MADADDELVDHLRRERGVERGLVLARARNQPLTAATTVVEEEILKLAAALVKRGKRNLRTAPSSDFCR